MKAENDANLREVEAPVLTALQEYQRRIGRYTGEMLTQIDRVEQACILMNSYTYSKIWRNHFGQFEHFQYHLEMYFLGVSGLSRTP